MTLALLALALAMLTAALASLFVTRRDARQPLHASITP